MAKVYFNQQDYKLDLKFEDYKKRFLEKYKITQDHDKAKELVFIQYPEYKELFQSIVFPEYQ